MRMKQCTCGLSYLRFSASMVTVVLCQRLLPSQAQVLWPKSDTLLEGTAPVPLMDTNNPHLLSKLQVCACPRIHHRLDVHVTKEGPIARASGAHENVPPRDPALDCLIYQHVGEPIELTLLATAMYAGKSRTTIRIWVLRGSYYF